MLTIGKTRDKEVYWNYRNIDEARLGIVSHLDSLLYKQWVKNILLTKCQEDPNSAFYITTQDPSTNNFDTLDILEREGMPTSEVENDEYKKLRMQWVQRYLDILCYKYNKERADFIPLATYRPHVEGPLKGYERAISRIEDIKHREILENEFSNLSDVKWYYKEGEGYQYYLQHKDLLLSLYKALWSFWLLTSSMTEPRDLLLIIEIPKEITNINNDSFIREIVLFINKYIALLTFDITLSCIFVSENLFPLPELSLYQYLIFENQAQDINWAEEIGYPVERLGQGQQKDIPMAIIYEANTREYHEIFI